MNVHKTHQELRASIEEFKAQGKVIALVPTMGALHEGHMSLIKAAKGQADIVVCSIFVNPTQFAEGEDFTTYPRDEAKDIAILLDNGADIVYIPSVEEMYPEREEITEPPIKNGDILEGEFRPHFFRGVGIVVTKLLHQCAPDKAFFGQKDYQQLSVIKQMVKSLGVPVEIIGCPTQREEDGLALSSRNNYLSVWERKIAPELHKIMQEMAEEYRQGTPVEIVCEKGKRKLLAAGFAKVDYLRFCDSQTLLPEIKSSARLLAAAWLGTTRLIDNIEV